MSVQKSLFILGLAQALLIVLLYCIPGNAAEQWTPAQIAQFDACSALFNWRATQPTCDALVKQSQHHLISEADYNNWCGMAVKYKKDAESNAAKYKKITHKMVIVTECPPESQYQQ